VNDLEEIIRNKLSDLNIHSFSLIDESYLHIGHAGAQNGAKHFRLRISAAAFAGKPLIACHRLVYAALGDLIPFPIHALALEIIQQCE
jgi:BolA protein